MGEESFSTVRFAAAMRRNPLEAMELLPDVAVARPHLPIPLVMVLGFDEAQQVLIGDADSFGKPGFVRRVFTGALGENMFTATGDEWLRRRRPVAPVFAAAEMNGLAVIMAQSIRTRIEGWNVGTQDLQDEMTRLTMSVACRAFLGIDGENDGAGRAIGREFTVLLDWLAEHLRNPLAAPAWAPTRRNRAMKTARAGLHAAVADVIARRRRDADDRDDVVGRLLRSQQERPEDIDDVDIIEECVGFLFAGHETTASTLTWALYELARNPDLQSEVAAEGRSLRLDADDLHDQIDRMAVTGAVVDETLRLYPSGISIVRQARRTTRIGAQRIRRGTVVMIPVYRIQRQEAAWAHPQDFDHTRFIDSGSPARHDAYLPFGLGPRRCLGARFARTEMRLALAMICQRWHVADQLSSPPRPEVNPAFRIAGQLPLRLERRTAPGST